MANIGDLYFSFRGDGARLKADAKKEGEAAGEVGGKGFTAKFKDQFKGSELKKGLLGGLGLGAGLGVADLVSKGLSTVVDQMFLAVDAASNLNEAMSKSDAVFKESSDEMEAWAETASDAFGQSKRQALEAASTYGNLILALTDGDVAVEKAGEMSRAMVELASDLASFNNTSVDEALDALRSGLSGETEPLKRYGVALNDARLKEEALRLGLIKTTKGVLPVAIKTQAAYSLILKDTALAQGDFARTSDGLANTQKTLAAAVEDAQAELGEALLPIMLELATFAKDDLVPAIRDIIAALKEAEWLFDLLGFAIEAVTGGPMGGMNRALRDQTEALEAEAEAVRKLQGYMKDASKDDAYIEHVEDVTAATDDLGDEARDTASDVRKSIRDMTKNSKEWRDKIIADAVAVINGAYDLLIAKQELTAINAEITAQRRIVASATASAAEKADARSTLLQLEQDRVQFLTTLAEAGVLSSQSVKDAIKDIQTQLKTATGAYRTALLTTLDLLTRLENQAQDTLDRIRAIPRAGTGQMGLQPMAEGGPVIGGTPYWVGEVGPELFVPTTSGTIVPHDESIALASSGGGDTTINVTLLDRMPAASVRDIGSGLRMLELGGYLGPKTHHDLTVERR